jgi:hypothetical protein
MSDTFHCTICLALSCFGSPRLALHHCAFKSVSPCVQARFQVSCARIAFRCFTLCCLASPFLSSPNLAWLQLRPHRIAARLATHPLAASPRLASLRQCFTLTHLATPCLVFKFTHNVRFLVFPYGVLPCHSQQHA